MSIIEVNNLTKYYGKARGIVDVSFSVDEGNYAGFQNGDMRLGIFKRNMMAEAIGTTAKPTDADCQDKIALIFEVPDVDEYHRQLKAKGVQFVKKPQDFPSWGLRAAYFRDPDGNLIEINSGLAASA